MDSLTMLLRAFAFWLCVMGPIALAITALAHGQAMNGLGYFVGTTEPLVGSKTAQCPMDRPYKRTIEGQITTCTLVMCVGKMICDDSKCWRGPSGNCNTCSREPDVVVCLSQEELDAAK